jgi:tumor protein p53-inducible protein 3
MLGGPPPKDAPALLGPILGKRLQVLGTTLRSRSADYKADLVAHFQLVAGPLLARGELRPVLDKVHFQGLDAIQEAHAYMASDQSMGKIVLSVL